MKIAVTLQEVLDSGDWDVFCEETGTCPWCVNEGCDPETAIEISVEQAEKYGLLKSY